MNLLNLLIKYLLESVIVLFAISLTLVTFFQVVNRYIFQFPILGTEELARYLSIWTFLLGAAYGVKFSTHIRIAIVVGLFPLRLQRLVDFLTSLICLVFLIIVALNYIKILPIVSRQVSPSLGLPMHYVYLAGPVSIAFMIWFFIMEMMRVFRR